MSETTTNESKSWTISTPGIIEAEPVELEDEPLGQFDEYMDLLRHCEKLVERIRRLKNEMTYMRGQVETWEKSWRIWNG